MPNLAYSSLQNLSVSVGTTGHHVGMANRRSKQRKKPSVPQRVREASPVVPLTQDPSGTPEDRRAAAVRRLVDPGQRRRHLAEQLEQIDGVLRPVVLEAIDAGVPYRRIAELTGISRATVSRWAKAEAPSG